MFNDGFLNFLFIIIVIVVGRILFKIFFKSEIIFDYEKGLLYNKGVYQKTLDAGKHWYHRSSSSLTKIDMRRKILTIKAQEMPSSDGVAIKVSLLVEYEITDPVEAIHKTESYQEALYSSLQIALRGLISSTEIDTIIAERNLFSDKLTSEVAEEVSKYGLKLVSVNIKDIIIPGDLKRIFAQSVKARKEANAALERARGETAALRNLANAAKMAESNPNLLYLRAIQMLGDSSGNTITLSIDGSEKSPVANKVQA